MGDDRVDEPGLRRLVRYVLQAGIHAVYANGSMGGFALLTDDEQVRSVAITISEVSGRVPVIACVGETGTTRAIRLARRIAAEGPDYIALLPPFYYLARQEHLIDFFGEVAAALSARVLLYDNPVLTKNSLQPETVTELLCRIPNLVGIKASDSNCVKLQAILSATRNRENFSVLTGSEHLLLVALQMGCHGAVGGLYNVCPHLAVRLWDAFHRGALEEAQQLQEDLNAVWEIFRYGAIWGAFDEAMRYLGVGERATGRPYVTPLDEASRATVRRILQRYVPAPEELGATHCGDGRLGLGEGR